MFKKKLEEQMKSYTLRKVVNFNLNADHPIVIDSINYGNIAKVPNASKIINGKSFELYQCSFLETLVEDIIVDGEVIEEYQKSKSFFLYYCQQENLILIETSTNIAKSFLKKLSDAYKDRVELKLFKFNFNSIKTNAPGVKGVYFNVEDDADVDSKAFFGNDVDNNNEASTAIADENATYLIISKDIAGTNRTIGFSQKSAIVLYNKVNGESGYLQLVIDTYDSITSSISAR